MQIAIDGPAGVGKSSTAKRVAQDLGFTYLDTGAMYRAVTALALKKGLLIDENNNELAELAKNFPITFDKTDVFIDGEKVTQRIRDKDVTNNVSLVAANKGVREALVERQRELAQNQDVVMDGRDIASVVLPNAELKIYLDATPECRALRRALELGIKEEEKERIKELSEDIRRRDKIDSTRKESPLIRTEDAYYLLTDDLSLEEVIETIKSKILELNNDLYDL